MNLSRRQALTAIAGMAASPLLPAVPVPKPAIDVEEMAAITLEKLSVASFDDLQIDWIGFCFSRNLIFINGKRVTTLCPSPAGNEAAVPKAP